MPQHVARPARARPAPHRQPAVSQAPGARLQTVPSEAWRPLQASIRDDLRPLLRLDNWHGPLACLGDWAVILLCVALAGRWPLLWPLAVLVIGARQRALASLLHESAHLTLCAHRPLNHLLGRWGAGLPIFHSDRAYRRSHVQRHHVHLGHPELDPDHLQYRRAGLYHLRSAAEFRSHVLQTLLLLKVGRYLRYLLSHRMAEILRHPPDAARLLLVHGLLAAVLTALAGPWAYPGLWLLPWLTSFQVIGWLSEICEHYPLAARARSPIEMSRNRFPTWPERLLVGHHGDNFHLVHHLFPGIPFWNLAEAHRRLLRSPTYADANRQVGGIFSAAPGRVPVLTLIQRQLQEGAAHAQP